VKNSYVVRLIIIVLISTFITESLIMFTLSFFPALSDGAKLLIDSILLIALLTPCFYIFFYLPLLKSTQYQHEIEIQTRINDTQLVLNEVLMLSLNEQSLNELLKKTLNLILSIKWLSVEKKGAIFLVDKNNNNNLILSVSKNLNDSLLSICSVVPFGRCLCGRAAEKREIIFSPSIDENHENTYQGIMPHGHYCVPIIFEKTLLGVINLYVKDKHIRKNEDDIFLKTFAAILAEVIVHYRNIEEIKTLTNNLIEKNKDLEQYAFISSHDLQEPLRTINSFIDLIGKEYACNMDINFKEYFSFIEQSANRMRALIKNILEYSIIGKNDQFTQVDCNILINDVLADLNTILNANQAQIEFGALPVIKALPIEIKQLFQNLIINAIKFKKENISPKIVITAKRENNYWLFAVHDNGIGIDKMYNDKIFQIFQQLHDRYMYEGFGAGLAFCKKIVELHNGRIWVESKLGEGSIFYFTIFD